MDNQFYTQLKTFGRVRANEPLSKHTTFHIGGPAEFLVEVEETEKLAALLNFLSAEGVPYFILGGGSNLLMSDYGFEGVVIKIRDQRSEIRDNIIEANAGLLLAAAINLALQNSLTGLEWAAGIPGTVGGAVRGNAGAMGSDISKSLKLVEVWRNGDVITLTKDECGFGYRTSSFKTNGDVILKAWVELRPGDKGAILKKVQEYLQLRQTKHPEYRSAGSFFKNLKLDKWPSDMAALPPLFVERGSVPAAWLIEQTGLKGRQVGDALITAEHCNFIVNVGSATQEQILTVVEEAQKAVYNKFGVTLEPEVEVVK